MKFAKRRRFPAFGSSAFRPDFAVSTRHQPRQDDAMPDDSRNLGDDQSVRGPSERGMRDPANPPRRPLSPLHTAAPHAAAAPSEREAAHRSRGRDIIRSPPPTGRDRSHRNRNTRPRQRSRSPPRPAESLPPYRHRSRDSSRDGAHRPGHSLPRHKHQGPRGSSWGREAAHPTDSRQPPPHQPRDPHTDDFVRQPSRPRPPPPAKRRRSRSPLPSAPYPGRSRHEHGPRRFEGDPDADRAAPYPIRPEASSSRRERSLTRKERRLIKKASGAPKAPPPVSRGRSPPPPRGRDFPDNPNLCPLGQRASPHRDHSPSSFSGRRPPSSPPRREGPPPPPGRRRRSIPDNSSRDGLEPVYDRERDNYTRPQTRSPSPRSRRASFSSKRQRRRDRLSPKELPSEPASGSNSIEINMSARGNFRGSYNGQYPARGHYSQGPHSSGHATPSSSFHGSPPAQSPYNGGRGNWGGQQQYSPQSQYPPQFPPNGYAPTAPAAHFQGGQANSPPVGTPTGPSHQFSQSPYRGGYRGSSSGGYRGNSAGPGTGRGAGRGGFKSGHWGSSGSGSRAASSQPEDVGSGRATPQAGSSIGDQGSVHGDVGAHETENPFRPPKEFQVEDTAMDEGNEEDPMPAPATRPPPTGPAAEKKISFALKSTPKAPVTAPKFEISSKFNAPTKKDPPKESSRHDPRDRDSRDARESRDYRDNRDNRDHRDHRDSRDIKGSRDNREHAPHKHVADGRDLPRNVPTEPRAAKEQQRRQEQQKPREPREPRVRMVKKKMKRLKEKPALPDHLAASDSVYFRKPGNESVIGAGTYGKVFKALHVYTKKLVALKRIRMEGERDGFPVTAVREIKLLQSLKHINIVALLEVMVEKNECYMVFEYMSHDLTGILNHPTFKLEAAHRKHLSKQLFEGLDYLHQRGVLHRDIKAANILVSSDGILKLADFGLARFYAKRHQLDYTNRVITIWYRSPELLLGETQYSPAVDIWSAACVMIEIFTRRAVFPGDGGEISQLDKIYSVLGTPHKSSWPGLTDMPWFELLRPGVRKPNVFAEQYEDKLPPAAFKLMGEMLQYDPLKRPTAAQVLEHPYFTTESPAPRQAVELQHVDGDWHEFESKALRRENERKDREARKAAEKGSGSTSKDNKDSRKRPPEANDANRETKRQHVEKSAEAPSGSSEVIPPKKT